MPITDERKVELSQLSTEELIEKAMLQQENIAYLNDDYQYIKFLLLKKMKSSKATKLQHPDIDCVAKVGQTEYNYGELGKVRELLDKEDIAKFYTPEHEDTIIIKEKYDMRVGNGFRQYGGDIAKFLDEATIKGDIKEVILKRKE